MGIIEIIAGAFVIGVPALLAADALEAHRAAASRATIRDLDQE